MKQNQFYEILLKVSIQIVCPKKFIKVKLPVAWKLVSLSDFLLYKINQTNLNWKELFGSQVQI